MQDTSVSQNPARRPAIWLGIAAFLTLALLGWIASTWFFGSFPLPVAAKQKTPPADTIPAGLRRLMAAYPGHFAMATANSVVWKDGTVMPYDDGIVGKDYETLLNNPDLEDQMNRSYVKGRVFPDPTRPDADTSRVRFTPFFEKMYGATREEVGRNLAVIRWLPKHQNLRFYVTKVNDVHKKLQAVSDELEQRPDLIKYVKNPGGAFNWRNIRGTERRSAHSFGIAFDINISYADYWL
ncbi:MAG: M15 family metallopeptidase, partial [Cytophagales bacterium]|nr:M15 family metallopeptidase [Cytophagales bacterium]